MADDTPFPHAFIQSEYGDGCYPYCLDELDIINIIAQIREKPNWETKVEDPSIVSKWRSEIEASGITQWEPKFEYAIAELKYYKGKGKGPYKIGTVRDTWIADNVIEESLRQDLLSQVSVLENVPDNQKDWHPGSNGLVLDLVHPSLYCYVDEKSKVSKGIHEVSKAKHEPKDFIWYESDDACLDQEEAKALAFRHTVGIPIYASSKKYQWLPTDFEVDKDGSVKFLSYINNLHPVYHAALHGSIERILDIFIPLFELVLTDIRNPQPRRIDEDFQLWYDEVEYPESAESESESEEEVQKPVKPIPIPTFSPPRSRENIVDLKGRKLQVIVKLCNIQLTPENSEYPGGVWHIEGMANERIVSTGIYYYSSENITESRLLFRQAVREPGYEQNDTFGVATVYNLKDEGPLNQNIGSILTKEGRCIAFPNTLQHRVAPFKLEDTSKSGHRKILVFFLIDPSIKILSTSRVPPQQMNWFLDEIEQPEVLEVIPSEVIRKILSYLHYPMDLTEAKYHRDELMKERKYFMNESNENYFERPFSLCEH